MKSQALTIRRGLWLAASCGLLISGLAVSASAQGFRGGGDSGGRGFTPPAPEDMFRRMDRNQNGQLDPDEIGFMRDMYSRAGIDVSRPISFQQFTEASSKVREQFEQARSSGGSSSFRRPEGGGPPSFGGGGPPSFGGGGPPSFGGGPPSSGERRSEESSDRDSRRDDRDRRDRDSDRSRESSSSGKSTKKTAKPKERVTKALPEDYRSKDKNGDGQIGLYEWDRSAFAQFQALDRNGDGLLTADELIAAAKKSVTSSKSSASTTASPSSFSSSNTGAAPIAPAATPTTAAAAPSVAVTTPTSPGMKVFIGLDSDNDGKLTEEEWKRSRTARGKFEKAGIAISFPIQQAQFVELYTKVEAQ
ncbi:MAG: hypothetical protein FD138_3047 [Planctomycetota bacterium]|nr:MAG: hypothetical protein FD138_3047 [Planctomycetota bacterium]